MREPLQGWAVNMALWGYDFWGQLSEIAGICEHRGPVDFYGHWDHTALDLDNQLVDRGNGWERAPDHWALRGMFDYLLAQEVADA